jgi:hypothetical protein
MVFTNIGIFHDQSVWVIHPFCVASPGMESDFIFGGGGVAALGLRFAFAVLVVYTIVVATLVAPPLV